MMYGVSVIPCVATTLFRVGQFLMTRSSEVKMSFCADVGVGGNTSETLVVNDVGQVENPRKGK